MILEDIVNGNGLIMIDPHGDLFNEVCGLIPESRIEDVVILDPTDMEYPVGLNLLEYQTREEKFFIIKEIQEIMRRLLEDEYGTAVGEFAGPLFFHLVEMALLLIMDNPGKKVTIYDFYEFFQNNVNWKKWKSDKYTEGDLLRDWVNNQLPDMDFTGRTVGSISIGEYVYGKFKDFIFDPKLRNIFKQENSTIDFRQIMNEGKILLVNLAKGELSEKNSRFLGMVIMSKIMSTALERIKCPKEKRRSFYVYVDEFQNIATSSFVVLLSEARKFGLGLVLANQFLWQIKNPQIREAIFGNVSNIISFRVGLEDAKMLDDIFLPMINANDLINLPNWQAAVRTSVDGRITSPFYIRTELAPKPDEETGHRIRERSREKYGRKISE
jgi:type IV secretory pathway TraG/TraD family ATPase VirD4